MSDVIKTVGRYEILREVGRGGMAMVYLARRTDLDRFVALKELGAFHASEPSFAQRFLRESRVAGSLSHPNIVTVHDYFDHDGTPYIAMEYLERGSLRPYVGKLTLAQIGGVLEGLLAGLTHAESHGIVHRDLKPENLLVTAGGGVKIADFGIAKATLAMETGALLSAEETTIGTPDYMAPEQAMAQDVGPWTDLYSVGCMAFELFTGKVPFDDSDAPMAILLRQVNEPIPAVRLIVPEVDQRISDWIEALLVKEPDKRTQNAQDAWDDFEEVLLHLLGPRWRREASLGERRRSEESDRAKPLTPAPVGATDDNTVESDEFKSFEWGPPAADAPPMYTPPPSESTPSILPPVVGPPTPMPSEAIPAPPAPDEEPVPETGFVTFGAPVVESDDEIEFSRPAPPMPPEALIPPPQAATAEAEPRRDTDGVPLHESRFDTYTAPSPIRPPMSEPAEEATRPADAAPDADRVVAPPAPVEAAPIVMPSARVDEPSETVAKRGGAFRAVATAAAAPVIGARSALRRRRRRRSAETVDDVRAPVCRTPHIDVTPWPRVTPGEMFDAFVFVDLHAPRRGETAEPIMLVAPPDRDEFELAVWLVATHHFRVLDAPVQSLTIRRHEDRSEAAAFRMIVEHAPSADDEPLISASFSYRGRPSGKVTLALSSAREPVADLEAPTLVVDVDAVQPDLTVEIVSMENDGRHFEVRVDTPLARLERRTETWSLPAASSALVDQAMLRFFDENASRSARIASLLGAGMEFFDAAPGVFKETFWRLHDAERAPRNLYVVSDERSIPWELMVPRRRTREGVETLDPLGVQLAVGRWHRQTQVSPRQPIRLRSSYVVAPHYKGSRELAFSGIEADYVCEQFNGKRIDPARFDHLDAVLAEGGADLLHFVCHGESDHGGIPVLLLEEPDRLDPQQVRAMRGLAAAFQLHKPLVFLNACELGRPVQGLIGASGFARSFIELDASGVIGTLWSVDDRTAHSVAIRFYEQLLHEPGVPFAEILRRIRAEAFSVEGDDSFAAYCFYGDPSAHVVDTSSV